MRGEKMLLPVLLLLELARMRLGWKLLLLKAVKTSLISEAKEFISHFQHMRANTHGKTDTNDDEEEEEDEDEWAVHKYMMIFFP